MAEIANLPPIFVIGLGVMLVGGVAAILTQMFTLRTWNLAPLFYGMAMSSLIWGAVLCLDELALGLLESSTLLDSVARHAKLADSVSTALSCLFVAGTGAAAVILVGSVLAYVREWMFREVL